MDKNCSTCKYYEPTDGRCIYHNKYYSNNNACSYWTTYKKKTDADRNPFHNVQADQLPGQMNISDFGL